ncbi:hypothetical protein NEHOM01_1241 [Nematocida homosporus]|uniref:uncharacterized protein n=1 Tax=Nematocida homosporus TaxID=1912981 RepID=UPI00221F5D4C|nr:uncharacterized protein NEHOM01_1241 [Nematocida homosporus]KAI5186038.1 hypothetical protein NEHOM01_1241 [Nematocida homosporus]
MTTNKDRTLVERDSSIEGLSATKRWASTSGLLALPMLFGMNLTNTSEVGVRKILSNSGVLVELSKLDRWVYVTSAMFIGAFIFSMGLFIAGLYKKSAHSRFKELFVICAGLFALSGLVLPHSDNIAVLTLTRFLVGVASGIACGLCMVYYMAVHPENVGKKVCTAHGLLICVGVMLQGRLVDIVPSDYSYLIFYLTTLLSTISLVLSLLFVKNIKEKKSSIEVVLISDGSSYESQRRTDRMSLFLIGSCLVMHVLQQLTGINPVLVNAKKLVFNSTDLVAMRPAKTFFDLAGLLGAVAGVGLMMVCPSKFTWIILVSSVATGLSYVPFFMDGFEVGRWWGAGLYYFFFSIMLAGLPWMLPSLVLTDKKNVSLAAGLGSLCNWLISFGLIMGGDLIINNLGSEIMFAIFMVCSFMQGLFGWWLLRYIQTNKKPASTKDFSMESSGSAITTEV